MFVAYLSEWLGAFAVAWLLSLSPRFQRPVIGFRYARRDGIAALSLAVVVVAFSFLFYGFNPARLLEPARTSPAPVTELPHLLLVAGISLLPFVAALVIRKQPVRSMGWNPPLLVPAAQLGVAAALLTIFLRNRHMALLAGLPAEAFTPLLLALGIGIAQETIFRGYVQMRLAWWLGPVPGIGLTALLSTLWHLPAWISLLPGEPALLVAGLTFIQALLLGWIMRKTGHVLAPALYFAVSTWVGFLG
jgi:membrane protease YdiL (CAAX protease family)